MRAQIHRLGGDDEGVPGAVGTVKDSGVSDTLIIQAIWANI